MIENLSYNLQELFQEIIEAGRAQGVAEQNAFNDLVEDVIEKHRRVGEIHVDSSTKGMQEHLQNRWQDYKTELGLDENNVQL